ncbi:YbaB/EbfC family nucleoid-associated protein [Streptomyces sp. NPDC057428]|uniref:YbaB/EbfC family nucleoid-associated protein n=1 Tax=Streptomyces sp. NPDC057428 TaxID=3346129 RepID=UPI00367FA1DE
MDLNDATVRRLLNSTRQLTQELVQAQSQLRTLTVQGTAGGGLVTVTINGKGALEDLVISPVAADPSNAQGLADMVVTAFRDARQNLTDRQEKQLRPVLESIRDELRDPPG